MTYYQFKLLADVDWLPTYMGGEGSASLWPPQHDAGLERLYQVDLLLHCHRLHCHRRCRPIADRHDAGRRSSPTTRTPVWPRCWWAPRQRCICITL
jgi:hypothetical protein